MQISRRTFIKSASLGAAAIVLSPFVDSISYAGEGMHSAGESNKKHPNIIVILADDLGWGDLSCYPQDPNVPEARIRTPNLDSLAAEGTRFTEGYATCMVCSPSRAGLLTGRYQEKFGWYEFKETLAGIPKDELMLQEFLKKRGYATACIGKWHLGHEMNRGPLKRGFDRFFGFLGGQHDYYDPRLGDPIHAFAFDYDAYIYDQDKPVEKIDYLTDELTRQALRFINEQAAAKTPFFLYLAYNAPHPPMQSTWDKLAPYAAEKGGKFSSRDLARAMIDSMDEDVGKILNRLMHLGIDRDTIVFFTSDNGGADDGDGSPVYLFQHNGGLRARKGFYWEGGIRVPFIIRWPGKVPKGLVYNEPVSHLDIYATCVAAAGAANPNTLEGVDLVPYICGQRKGVPHETMYWGQEEAVGRWAVRKGKWKLTREYRDPQTTYDKTFVMVTELHDIEADPYEKHDLASAEPDIVKKLTKLKDDFYRQCPVSLATPAMMKAWEDERKERYKRLPNPDALQHYGAPGHGL